MATIADVINVSQSWTVQSATYSSSSTAGAQGAITGRRDCVTTLECLADNTQGTPALGARGVLTITIGDDATPTNSATFVMDALIGELSPTVDVDTGDIVRITMVFRQDYETAGDELTYTEAAAMPSVTTSKYVTVDFT